MINEQYKYSELTSKIIGCAMVVHKRLGNGFQEVIYQRLGYQRPAENLALFEEAGFRVVEHQGMEKTWLQSPSAYTKLSQFGTVGGRLFAWASRLGQQPFFYPYTALMRLIDTLICPWLPADWARMDRVVCEKKIPKERSLQCVSES